MSGWRARGRSPCALGNLSRPRGEKLRAARDFRAARALLPNARAVRGAVKTWWLEHDASACPSVKQLVDDQILDKDNAQLDPWGKPWRIECADNDVTIYSDGDDRTAGTADDIRIPPT